MEIITKAAEVLPITQPTLSRQISQGGGRDRGEICCADGQKRFTAGG